MITSDAAFLEVLLKFSLDSENRLKKLKGQSSDVTSRDMLRSLSQAKKECWDRFLHDAQTSELFQGGDMDERQDKRDQVVLRCRFNIS